MDHTIRQYLTEKKYSTASDTTYSHIDTWLEWYRGEVEKFHKYKIYNGSITVEQEMYRLGMAKKVCEDWANLLLNEKVAIKAGDYEERLNEILEENNFKVRGNQLVELAFALGTGAFVEYKDADGHVMIDFVRADMIYPLSWDNGDVTECAFGSNRVVDGKEAIYLQIHRKGNFMEEGEEAEDPDLYYIENKYIDAESGSELDLPEGMAELIPTEYDRPLFQIITPNVCNNVDLDSPLGISIFANSISQLKGCDLIYDSYMNEYVLGRKRILVPLSQAKRQMEKDGISAPAFDSRDTVYYMLPDDRGSEQSIKEVDMSIRASDHELGIQRSLDLLSLKVGMGTGRYKFENGGVKTATEVISDKSDLYQNRQKNAIILQTALIGMAKAVAFLDNSQEELTVTIDFDDSIIEDTNTTIDRNIKLVNAGLRSKLSAVMEINKCSEEEAKKELDRIAQDGQITGQDIDWTQTDDEDVQEEIDVQGKEGIEDGSSGEPAGSGSGRQ
ncbi:MAG TPA: phage portal protein [Candidatus Anaerostipes excrementavium]|uniref:Phage portal protein n=1 Tax=Candidatus Anaerostipes excrementavium TaxID=2838463 RepID=A0A9D2B9H1_9FIRM|nr:phage portal protein [uncultured Anaerostipes sp.]HIX67227.1 phage portal protein [Candidatus Anaerostipes excrementavium]